MAALLIFCLSLLSVVQHCNQSDHITKLSDTLNLIFTVLFTGEMIVKLIAFKAKVLLLPHYETV